MNDELRAPTGKPMNDEGETGLGSGDEAKADEKEVEETDERISDDPVVEEEDGTSYDPAAQAPTEAER